MRLHTLKPNPGAKHRRKRLGSGESSGKGKTSGKGHKGQKSRSGSGAPLGFEGGQMPIYRRLPRRGFNNARFRDKIVIVNVGDLSRLVLRAGATDQRGVTCVPSNLVKGTFDGIKDPGGRGTFQSPSVLRECESVLLPVRKIEKAGGSYRRWGITPRFPRF